MLGGAGSGPTPAAGRLSTWTLIIRWPVTFFWTVLLMSHVSLTQFFSHMCRYRDRMFGGETQAWPFYPAGGSVSGTCRFRPSSSVSAAFVTAVQYRIHVHMLAITTVWQCCPIQNANSTLFFCCCFLVCFCFSPQSAAKHPEACICPLVINNFPAVHSEHLD